MSLVASWTAAGALTFQNSSLRPWISAAILAETPMTSSIASTNRKRGLPMTRSRMKGSSRQSVPTTGMAAVLRRSSKSLGETAPRWRAS